MGSPFLTANIAGIESLQPGDQAYGYDVNRIAAVLNGINPVPLILGPITTTSFVVTGGIGLYGHAIPAQPAAPVTLADVIAIIRGCGLSA